MKSKWVSIIGTAAAVAGIVANFATDWARSKETEQLIDEKIQAAMTENEEDEDEES